MTFERRTTFLLALSMGVVFLLGAASQALARGPKIDVGDDPSVKEGSPDLVLVEIADFQ